LKKRKKRVRKVKKKILMLRKKMRLPHLSSKRLFLTSKNSGSE
jgi:hypothetical protein